ncbi:MAG: HD domain-containing phosphohydrolase [Planctomycetota bacterium]
MTSISSIDGHTFAAESHQKPLPAPAVNAPLIADEAEALEKLSAPAATNGLVGPNHGPVPPGKIMIVDDEIANVLVAKKLLEHAGHKEFQTTTDSTKAINLVHTYQPDVVLLDINMPHVDGISILTQIRSVPKLQHLPVLILTANHHAEVKLRCLELGATDFLVKPIDPMELAPRVRNALQSKLYHDRLESHAAELEETVHRRTQDLEHSRREVIYCLARAAELRDNDTGNHVIRVGRYAGIVARNLGLPERFVKDVELAAQLHDVGKIAIPDSILLKPGKLEPEEYEIIQGHVKHGRQIIKPFGSEDVTTMRDHVTAGSDILGDGSSLMRLAASIAQTHHEKFDGSGYPIGLAGEDIPIEGRITAVADVFDALASERPYKKALPREKCFEILEEGRGSHFDPQILDAFFAGTADIVRVQLEYMDYQA